MTIRLFAVMCSALMGITALSSQALAQPKTVKACEDEWRAKRAENQAADITEKAYVAQCRAGNAAAKPPTSAAATAAKSTQPVKAAAAPSGSAPAAATRPMGANQFSTEALASARCRGDTVVWVNLTSGIYHFAGNKEYGKTKSGAYMCEKDTSVAKFRAAKNEKHPS